MAARVEPCRIAGGVNFQLQEDPLSRDYNIATKRLLGSGTDGTVLRGYRKGTREWHALKFISRASYRGTEIVREWEILERVRHPNIVRVLGCYPPFGSRVNYVMCMPEADMTLLDFMGRAHCIVGRGRNARLGPYVVRDLMAQLLSALQHLHADNWMHRDIKPNNILLSLADVQRRSPRPDAGGLRTHLWLADFSRAHQITAQPSAMLHAACLTAGVGCEVYAAPEVFLPETHAEEPYDQSVDIWSTGAVFFEFLTLDRLVPDWCSLEKVDIVWALERRLGRPPEGVKVCAARQ